MNTVWNYVLLQHSFIQQQIFIRFLSRISGSLLIRLVRGPGFEDNCWQWDPKQAGTSNLCNGWHRTTVFDTDLNFVFGHRDRLAKAWFGIISWHHSWTTWVVFPVQIKESWTHIPSIIHNCVDFLFSLLVGTHCVVIAEFSQLLRFQPLRFRWLQVLPHRISPHVYPHIRQAVWFRGCCETDSQWKDAWHKTGINKVRLLQRRVIWKGS